jgi:hypothetical protein
VVGGNPEEFSQYLSGIGMGAAQIEQAQQALATARGFLPDDPIHLFVSEYRDDEGVRNYESLWIFTETAISEATPFSGEGSFDLIRRDTGLDHVEVGHVDFDFETPVDASRLVVGVTFKRTGSNLSATLRASGSNCGDLGQILRDYLLTTMFGGPRE